MKTVYIGFPGGSGGSGGGPTAIIPGKYVFPHQDGTTRDQYFQKNPNELQSIKNNPDATLISNNGKIEYYNKKTDAWEHAEDIIQGPPGVRGIKGVGISSIAFARKEADGNVYTVTMSDRKTYEIKTPGADKGVKGDSGDDGVGIASITYEREEADGNVYVVTMTDQVTYEIKAPKGPKGDPGGTGTGTVGLTPAQKSALDLVIKQTDEISKLSDGEAAFKFLNGLGQYKKQRATQVNYSNSNEPNLTTVDNALDWIISELKKTGGGKVPAAVSKKVYYGYSKSDNLIDPTKLDEDIAGNFIETTDYKGNYDVYSFFLRDPSKPYLYFFIPESLIPPGHSVSIYSGSFDQTSTFQSSKVTYDSEKYYVLRSVNKIVSDTRVILKLL